MRQNRWADAPECAINHYFLKGGKLKGRNQLPKVIEGIKFNDGVEVTDSTENRAA